MKTTALISLVAASLTFGGFAGSSNADIAINNFALTETTLGFDISGTFPNPLPADRPSDIYFVNPDVAAVPGFALGSGITAFSSAFSGAQLLSFVTTGVSNFGDFFGVRFANDFSVNESISGTITAT